MTAAIARGPKYAAYATTAVSRYAPVDACSAPTVREKRKNGIGWDGMKVLMNGNTRVMVTIIYERVMRRCFDAYSNR